MDAITIMIVVLAATASIILSPLSKQPGWASQFHWIGKAGTLFLAFLACDGVRNRSNDEHAPRAIQGVQDANPNAVPVMVPPWMVGSPLLTMSDEDRPRFESLYVGYRKRVTLPNRLDTLTGPTTAVAKADRGLNDGM